MRSCFRLLKIQPWHSRLMCKEVFCMYIYSAGDGCMVHLGKK